MSIQAPVTPLSLSTTVTGSAVNVSTTLEVGQAPGTVVWEFVANTDAWITQSTTAVPVVATAGAGSMFVPARAKVAIDGSNGQRLSVVRDSADGRCSLTPLQLVK